MKYFNENNLMKKGLELIDIIGVNPSILINHKRRHSTIYGGVISLLCYLSISIIALIFSKDFFGRTQSSIIYNYEQTRYLKRNLSKFPYTLRLMTAVGGVIPDNFYYIHSELWKMQYFNVSGQIILNTTRVVLKQEKCDINKHFGDNKYLFENVTNLKDSYCPVPNENDLEVKTPYGETIDNNFIQHYVVKCTNDTKKNVTNCAPMDKINSNLANVFLITSHLEYSLDHNDFNSPGKLSLRTESPPMSSSIFTRVWLYITNIKYLSDDGLVFESRNSYDYFKYNRPTFTYNLIGSVVPNSISVVTITMDNKFDIYQRNYSKAQNLLANVGGITKAVLTIAYIISYLFSTTFYDIEVTSSLFRLNWENCDTKKTYVSQFINSG